MSSSFVERAVRSDAESGDGGEGEGSGGEVLPLAYYELFHSVSNLFLTRAFLSMVASGRQNPGGIIAIAIVIAIEVCGSSGGFSFFKDAAQSWSF